MNEQDLESSNSINDTQLSPNIYNDDINNSHTSHESKNSTKANTKLARIRSFKDDFLEKLSQMRTPTNTLRPHSPKIKKGIQSLFQDDSKYSHDLDYHIRQVKNTLTHFSDVINKNKLEMLPGNGTILLESIANINSSLKNNKFYAQSSVIISSVQRMQLILGKIIKICDDALVSDEEEDFIALNKENINDLIAQLHEGVNNLIDVANEQKNSEQMKNHQQASIDVMTNHSRNSLPDITTPKDDSKQERYYSSLSRPNQVKKSHSNENILNEAPPLPPKKLQLRDLVDNSRSILTNDDETDNHHQFLKPNELSFKSSDKNSSTNSICSILNDINIDNNVSFNQKEIEKLNESIEECKSPKHRTSNESGFVSFTSQSSVLKHQQNSQIVFQKDFNLLDNVGSMHEAYMKEENVMIAEKHTWSQTKYSSTSEIPPPLPVKTKRLDHHKSMYDNLEGFESNSPMIITTTTSSSSSSLASSIAISNVSTLDFGEQKINMSLKNKYHSCIEPRSLILDRSNETMDKPPLPPKQKKHIICYMEIFGNATSNISNRHSLHTFSHQSKMSSQERIFTEESNSILSEADEEVKPALPPKKLRTPKFPYSPAHSQHEGFFDSEFPLSPTPTREMVNNNSDNIKPNSGNEFNQPRNSNDFEEREQVVMRRKSKSTLNLMEEMDIHEYLTFKKEDEDGPDIKGGHLDALIVHATKVQKISEAFGEAFLSTFRTFIEPLELVEKLTYRYSYFNCHIHDQKQKAAKESFSLLVRVVNDLTLPDLNIVLMQKLIDFVYNLVICGEILMAKLLRAKVIEKATLLRQKRCSLPNNLSSLPVISNPPTLLDLKSTDIAEQMTILDAELFEKIEVPEVLLWSQQQCEAMSPNLTLFTAHFNKLSFWARTQILKQQDSKDREKYVMKFIKIMKHLRKINNYNSYLAILSALDSAPIRRLEWQKNITEGLKEYCALIDSSSSFRTYRQALSETTSPCIPYIGLVLQDLTFVHIGNPDCLSDGSINFSKRWQQYNIVMNMKRFRNSSYAFRRNERVIGFFDNFEDHFDEEILWQISERIKPRRKNY